MLSLQIAKSEQSGDNELPCQRSVLSECPCSDTLSSQEGNTHSPH